MTQTVYGPVWDRLGLVHGESRTTPAGALLDHQDPVSVDFDHDHQPVGRVIHLERSRHGQLWAVAEVDDSVVPAVTVRLAPDEVVTVPHDLFWSSETIGGPDHGLALLWLSLTARPGAVSPRPVAFLPGAPDHRHVARERWNLRAGPERDLLTRAAYRRLEHRAGSGITVHDCETADAYAALGGRYSDDVGAVVGAIELAERRPGALSYSAPHRGSVISVS